MTPNPNEVTLSEFRIFETEEFLRKLKKSSLRDTTFLRKELDIFVYPQLKVQPFWGNNIKKLKGFSSDIWRYRIGKFRLFYVADQEEQVVYILTIHDRKDAYKRVGWVEQQNPAFNGRLGLLGLVPRPSGLSNYY